MGSLFWLDLNSNFYCWTDISFSKKLVTHVFPVTVKNNLQKYLPVSILPVISKIFEKLFSKQTTSFMGQFLPKYRCGFRKRFSAQHCLLPMLKKWKKAVDTKKCFSALLTDLSKAFDCLPHNLIIATINA